jgi:hypothetical protein
VPNARLARSSWADFGGIREDEDGPRNWGDHGNLDLHGWAFDRFTTILNYKAETEGVTVETVSERNTSKSCSVCGRCDDSQRVEHELYVCDEIGIVASADTNGAKNIRQTVLPTPERGDRITAGWHSQQFACSTAGRAFSLPENRSRRTASHNIPTSEGKLRRSRREGCHDRLLRMRQLESWYRDSRKRYTRQCTMTKSNDERNG